MQLRRKITIKSHETEYRGLIFRSKLEVRWAFLFDCLGVSWEYETKFYQIGKSSIFPDGKGYIPDFDLGYCTAEVKPDDPTGEEIAKALGVLGVTRKPFYFLIGSPDRFPKITSMVYDRQCEGGIRFGIIPNHKALKVSADDLEKAIILNRRMIFQKKRKV